MIITRTPFRVSFCGGGTDIPIHYRKHGGCVISTSIDKYVYITLTKSFHPRTILKYSVVENVDSLDKIEHPILRELLMKYNTHGVEINSTSNIPAGTGLGSSSAFTVGVTNSVRTYNNQTVSKRLLAEEACDIEINRMKLPIGKQDQYASAYGGLNFIKFNKNDTVDVEPIDMYPADKSEMFNNLLLFYIGGTRSSSKIIEGYGDSSNSLISLSKMAEKLKYDLLRGSISSLGKILDEGWRIKRSISEGITNSEVDGIYEMALNNGAIGGKLLGAGSKGFMLFYVEKDSQNAVRGALSNYKEMKFTFDDDGSKVIYNDEI